MDWNVKKGNVLDKTHQTHHTLKPNQPEKIMISIFMENGRTVKTWIVYEHWLDATECIYVGCTTLDRLAEMKEPRTNREWLTRVADKRLEVRLVGAFTEHHEAEALQMRHIDRHQPHCNYHTVKMGRSGIMCSNGVCYPTQSHAAAALAIAPSSISKVLNGKLKAACGYTFWYAQ